jgi:UDPglucose 6-dehydrogenase
LTAINTISAICEKTGGDVAQVAKCVGADSRINDKFMKASIGFGGYCLEKDVKSLVYIAKSLGLHEVAEYWDRVVSFNRFQMSRFGEQIISGFNNCLKNKKILLSGAAFKANTSDCRNSCTFEVLKVLLEESGSFITIFDPYVSKEEFVNEFRKFLGFQIPHCVTFISGLNEEDGSFALMAGKHDGIAFLTDHALFKNSDEEFMKFIPTSCLVFDGQRVLEHSKWKMRGYDIFTLGTQYK